jgi:hypothetical protein
MSNERLITDLSRQGFEELALVVRENLKAKEAERISPYVLMFDFMGEPNFSYEKETGLGKMECLGMKSMWGLANDNFKYVIWLSPPLGLSGYKEGRVVVGKVLEAGESTKIECRGIPILKDRDQFKKIADKLGYFDLEVEELREKALGINLENDNDFWDKCEEVFEISEVWDYIREGKDIRNRDETEVVVKQVMTEIKTMGVRNEAWYFEMMMKNRGFEIVAGNHGGINTIGAFGNLFLRSEIAIKAERIDGRVVCPCGEVLKEGEMRCKKCGLRIKTGES